MSGPWWVKGSCVKPPTFTGIEPLLLASGRASVIADVTGRIAAYTPEWTAVTADDAGVALVTLFGGMMEPVLTRLDQLPVKAFVEALRIVGIDALAAEPASVQLQFTILDSATGPALRAGGVPGRRAIDRRHGGSDHLRKPRTTFTPPRPRSLRCRSRREASSSTSPPTRTRPLRSLRSAQARSPARPCISGSATDRLSFSSRSGSRSSPPPALPRPSHREE